MDQALVQEIVRKVVTRLAEEGKHTASAATASTTPSLGVFDTVSDAAKAAEEAQGRWISMPLEDRKRIIEKIRVVLRGKVQILAELAVSETGYGRVEDKVGKNLLVINKTPGIEFLYPDAFSGDNGLTITERAPYGIIGSITPVTNPSETIINNAIGMIAGGNAVVFNAHPGAKGVSALTVHYINEVIHGENGPRSLLTCVRNPTIESANEVLKETRIRLGVVTGGPAVVKAAMQSGKKVIAAGPGNPPVVVDETADIATAAIGIIKGGSLDNNIICIGEKETFVVWSVAEQLISTMQRHGAYLVKGRELDLLEKLVLDNGFPNKKYIGKDADLILRDIGITVGKDIRQIIVETDANHLFVQREMMMPIMPIVKTKDVKEAIVLALQAEHGYGHTAGMYSRNIEHMDAMARVVNTSIFVKNAPHYAGLGLGGEGYTSFTIASPTGEGLTTVRNFTRERRCTLANYFRIV